MSHASAKIRFEDGTIMYGKFYNTVHQMRQPIFTTIEERNKYNWDEFINPPECQHDEEKVEIYVEEGEGFYWTAFACRKCNMITSRLEPNHYVDHREFYYLDSDNELEEGWYSECGVPDWASGNVILYDSDGNRTKGSKSPEGFFGTAYLNEIRSTITNKRKGIKSIYQTACINLGSEPKALFVDGKFTSDNWRSGDGLPIRNIVEFIKYNEPIKKAMSDPETEDFISLLAIHIPDHNSENHYYDILIKQMDCDDAIINNHYQVKIYKDRGRIEGFTCNGHDITEDEYVIMLAYFFKYFTNIHNYFKVF